MNLLEYIVQRMILPQRKHKLVEQYVRLKPPTDQSMEIDLFEIEDQPGHNMKTRFALIFATKDILKQFLEDWNKLTTRKAQIDQYIQVGNILLIYLKMQQVRVGIMAKQASDLVHRPVYVLGLQQTYRQIRSQIKSNNSYFRIVWIKTNQETPPSNNFKSSYSKEQSSQSQSSEVSEQSRDRSRSRSRHKLKDEKLNNQDCVTMIEQLEQCSEALVNQIQELENYLTGFFTLVQQTSEKIQNQFSDD